MIWPTADLDAGVIASIAQLYSIFLSTLFSIKRQQLSLFDANYALIVTSSPLTVHLVFASICELLGHKTRFFERIKSHPRTIYWFGAPLLPLWFVLRLTVSLPGRAFIDSELCSDPDLLGLLLYFSFPPFVNAFFFPHTHIEDIPFVFRAAAGSLHSVHYIVYDPFLFGIGKRVTHLCLMFADTYWIIDVILNAVLGSGKGYVLSYGQV